MVLLDLNFTPPEEDNDIPEGGHVDQHGDINMEEEAVDPGQYAVGEHNLVHCSTHSACEFIPVKNVQEKFSFSHFHGIQEQWSSHSTTSRLALLLQRTNGSLVMKKYCIQFSVYTTFQFT